MRISVQSLIWSDFFLPAAGLSDYHRSGGYIVTNPLPDRI